MLIWLTWRLPISLASRNSTMMENSFPISLVKVMSPNPNVDMTVSVQ